MNTTYSIAPLASDKDIDKAIGSIIPIENPITAPITVGKPLNAVNKTIAEMKANGDYEKLVAAYMPVDGKIVVPAIAAVASSKVIKLGTNAAFPPFEYVEGKDIVGFDISMGQKIAKTADMKLEVVDMAFDSLIPALQAGTIDFIAAGM